MDHQVLARKWRPRNFEEMVGQEHVLKALINALEHNRLHHAYLFTGTRGVGKTTIARILAKCLNCEQGVTARPCDTCAACVEINEGRCVDLIEVDAASRTKVEDTRELLDNVQYLPTRTRFKVYLIDEVHMLSSHSFNALLKTLEEPPPHVKFLLATTDPQKLPVTILSRCLQFNLKNMPAERVVEHLRFVLDQEQVSFEEPALWQLGRAADGSMRDALSLTDQAIAFGEGSVLEADVASMLGSIDRGSVYRLFEALLAKDAAQLLACVSDLAQFGPDYGAVLESLIALLHRVAVAQAVPEAPAGDVSEAEKVGAYAQQVDPEDLQLYYQIALIGRRDLPLNPDPRAGLEMVLLRMLAFTPVAETAEPEPKKKPLNKAPDLEPQARSAPAGPVTAKRASGAAQALAVARGDSRPQVQTQPEAPAKLDLVVDNARPESEDSVARQAQPSTDIPPWESEAAPHEESAALAEPAAAAEEASKANPANSTPVGNVEQAITLADLQDNEAWIRVVDETAIRGMTRNILQQCAFESREGNRLNLLIDPQYIDLLNASHQNRIEQALSETLGARVDIKVNAQTPTQETPAAWQQRVNAERLAAARASLEADENVRAWIETLGASLEVDSIQPLD